jgi:CDP-glycerol glycerophosphotransferase
VRVRLVNWPREYPAEWALVESDPALTVIVPTHDVEPWIDDCLSSIRTQEGVSLRVVVVDDHSSDGTLEIVRRHAFEDARVTVVQAENRGGGPARNLGVSLVETEFLAFADGDDLVPPGAYAALVGSLAETGSDMAVGNFYKFSALRSWRPSLRWHAFDKYQRGINLEQHPVLIRNRACWNRAFRTSFWVSEGLAFPDVRRSNDIVPMTTALVRARAIDVVPDFVYLYRERPGTGSMTASATSAEALDSYLSQELACLSLVTAHLPAVMPHFERLFFDADGWVHLSRALPSVDTPDSVLRARIASSVRELLRSADPAYVGSIHPLRRLVFRLVAAGKLEVAAGLLASAERGWSAESALEDVRQWAEAAETTTEGLDGARADSIAALILEPLLAVVATIPVESLADLLHPIASLLNEPTMSRLEAASAHADAARAARAIVAGDHSLLVELGRARGSDAALLASASLRRGKLVLAIRGDALGSSPVLVGDYLDSGQRVRLVPLKPDPMSTPGSLEAVLTRGKLREGTIELGVSVRDDDLGSLVVPLTAEGRGPIAPVSRWARFVVLPRRQPGDVAALAVRPPLVERLMRRFRTLARL